MRSISWLTQTAAAGSLIPQKRPPNRRPKAFLTAQGMAIPKDKKVLACLLNKLVQRTRQSCEVLGELLKQTEAELTSLLLVQRQARAYGRQA